MKNVIKLLNQIIFWFAAVFFAVRIYGGNAGMPIYAVGVIALILIIVVAVFLRFVPKAKFLAEPGYFQLGVLAGIYLICLYLGEAQSVINGIAIAFFVTLLLKVIYDNLREADEFIRNRAASTRIDEAKLKKMNQWITLLYASMLGVILMVIGLVRADGLSEKVLGGIKNLLQMIFSVIEKLSDASKSDIIEESYTTLEPNMGNNGLTETAPVWIALETVIELASAVFVAAVAIFAIVRLVKAFSRNFYHNQNTHSDAEDYVEPLTDRKTIGKAKRNNFFEKFERTPAKRIRKYYRKMMGKYGTSNLLEYLNPSEQMEQLEKSYTQNEKKEIVTLYEKARYAKESVSEAEVKRMQELLR